MNVEINCTRFKTHQLDRDSNQLETIVIWISTNMTHGAAITLRGFRHAGELARFDYLEKFGGLQIATLPISEITY